VCRYDKFLVNVAAYVIPGWVFLCGEEYTGTRSYIKVILYVYFKTLVATVRYRPPDHHSGALCSNTVRPKTPFFWEYDLEVLRNHLPIFGRNMKLYIIYNKLIKCNSGSIVFINNYKYVLHVSDALCFHHQEHYKL